MKTKKYIKKILFPLLPGFILLLMISSCTIDNDPIEPVFLLEELSYELIDTPNDHSYSLGEYSIQSITNQLTVASDSIINGYYDFEIRVEPIDQPSYLISCSLFFLFDRNEIDIIFGENVDWINVDFTWIGARWCIKDKTRADVILKKSLRSASMRIDSEVFNFNTSLDSDIIFENGTNRLGYYARVNFDVSNMNSVIIEQPGSIISMRPSILSDLKMKILLEEED